MTDNPGDYEARLNITLDGDEAAIVALEALRQRLRDLARESSFGQLPSEIKKVLGDIDGLSNSVQSINTRLKETSKIIQAAGAGRNGLKLVDEGNADKLVASIRAADEALKAFRATQSSINKELRRAGSGQVQPGEALNFNGQQFTVGQGGGVSEEMVAAANAELQRQREILAQIEALQLQLLNEAEEFVKTDVASQKAAQTQVASFLKERLAGLKQVQLLQDEIDKQDLAAIKLKAQAIEAQAKLDIEYKKASLIADEVMAKANREAAIEKMRLADAYFKQYQQNEELIIEQEKEADRITQQRLADAIRARGANPEGGTGRGTTFPTFLSYSLFPVARLASTLGATGAAGGLFAATDIIAFVDASTQVEKQIVKLGTRLTALSGPLGALADLGSLAATRLGATAGGLGASLGAIAAVILPVAAILLILVKIFTDMEAAAKKAADQAKAELGAQKDVNTLLAQGATTKELKQAQKDQQESYEGIAKTLSDVKPLIDEYNDAIGNNGDALHDVITGVLNTTGVGLVKLKEYDTRVAIATNGRITSIKALVEAYNAEVAAGDQTKSSLQALSDVLTGTGTAAQQAALALNDLHARQIVNIGLAYQNAGVGPTGVITSPEQAASQNTQLRDLLRSGTRQQVQDLIYAQNDQIRVLAEQRKEYSRLSLVDDQYTEKLKEVEAAITEAGNQLKFLNSILGQITRQEHLRKIAEDLQKTYDQITQTTDQYQKDIAQLDKDYAEQQRQANVNLQRQQDDLAEGYKKSQQAALQGYLDNLTDLATQTNLRRADIEDKYRKTKEDLEDEHEKKLLDIAKKYNGDIEDAIANRDAVALYNARKAETDAQTQESQDYTEKRAQAADQHKQDLADLDKNYQEQQDAALINYNRQLRDLKQANEDQKAEQAKNFARQQHDQKEQYDRQYQERNTAYQLEYDQLNSHLSVMRDLQHQYQTATEDDLKRLISGQAGTSSQTAVKPTVVSGTTADLAAAGFLPSAALTGPGATVPTAANASAATASFLRALGYSGYAGGGRYAPGKPFWAGENGRELIYPSTAGVVIPSELSAMMARMGGGSPSLSFPINGLGLSRAEVKQIAARTVDDAFDYVEVGMGRG